MDSGKKLKIGVVFTSLQMVGIAKSLSVITNYLSERNDTEITAFTIYKFPHFFKLNNNITLIEPEFEHAKTNKLYYYIKIFWFLRRNFKRKDFDVILTFHEYCNFQVLLASLGLNTPVIISDRASPIRKISFPSNYFRKYLYPFASGMIAQTSVAKEIFGKEFKKLKNIEVIGNAIDSPNHSITLERENIILWVGRYEGLKGLNVLIDAFVACKNMDDWKLVLVGDGDGYSQISTLIDQFDFKHRIIQVGKQKDVNQWYSKAEIFAFPSFSEGFPNALCEAMSMGLAAISFDCVAGPSEIIVDQVNGLLIPVGDVKRLTESIMILAHNKSKREQIQVNAKKIIHQFNREKIGNQYFDFLEKSKRIK